MTQEGWKAPHLNSSAREEGRGQKEQITVSAKNLRNAGLSPVLQGMDRGEVLAYINRVFDAQAAGAVLWGDKLLVKKFLNSCSRSGSIETRNGYMREIRYLMRWQNKNHPKLHLQELDPAICQDFCR